MSTDENRKVMIAVFANPNEHRFIKISPKNTFIIIRGVNDVRGRRFTHIMQFYDWYNGSPERMEAYDHLKLRQPELFK